MASQPVIMQYVKQFAEARQGRLPALGHLHLLYNQDHHDTNAGLGNKGPRMASEYVHLPACLCICDCPVSDGRLPLGRRSSHPTPRNPPPHPATAFNVNTYYDGIDVNMNDPANDDLLDTLCDVENPEALEAPLRQIQPGSARVGLLPMPIRRHHPPQGNGQAGGGVAHRRCHDHPGSTPVAPGL